MGKIKKIL